MALDVNQLLAMSQTELDTLFIAHEAGPIPDGGRRGMLSSRPAPSLAGRLRPPWHDVHRCLLAFRKLGFLKARLVLTRRRRAAYREELAGAAGTSP